MSTCQRLSARSSGKDSGITKNVSPVRANLMKMAEGKEILNLLKACT